VILRWASVIQSGGPPAKRPLGPRSIAQAISEAMQKSSRRINFATATHDELDEYGMQLLVWDAPELSVVLKGHLLIEQVIETLISQRMKHPDRFFGNQGVTFDLKTNLASALGVLPEPHFSAAKALNKIRNAYAHNEDHKLTFDELNSLKIRWIAIQKRAYAAACTKGVEEAARIAIIFLNWSFLKLLQKSSGPTTKQS